MIYEKCDCKSECEYYSTNEYLFALFKYLDAYTCDCYESQESEDKG